LYWIYVWWIPNFFFFDYHYLKRGLCVHG